MRRQTPELLLGESREAFLRRAIDDAGLTLKDFAIKAGLPVTSLGTILKRGVGTTSIDTAIKICDALEISIETLARGEYHSGTSDDDIAIIDIADRLRKTRFALGFREAAIAEMLDISLEQYRRFESTHYMVPSRYIRLISNIMGVSYEYLVGKQTTDETLSGVAFNESPESLEAYDLGMAIASLRAKCGLTQLDLANQMSIPERCIQQWEQRIRVPNSIELAKLCDVFSQNGLQVTLSTFCDYPATPDSMQLTNKEQLLIKKYRNAEEKEKRIVEVTLDV